MLKPPTPHMETQRLQSLYSLKILDTQTEERSDRITRLAAKVFGVSIALVSLVDKDRQWFKSRQGLDVAETHRDISFCGHAILRDDILVVNDTTTDDRFSNNPLVTENPHIRFYAGYPLNAPGGHKVGTLCLIDSKPREFSSEDKKILQEMGEMVEQEMFSIAQSTIDELTHISNRWGFNAICGHVLAMCRRTKQPAMLTVIDLDGFKEINDRYGHFEGDRALQVFAKSLLKSFRDSDVIARMGGDEFCVLLTNADNVSISSSLDRLRIATAEALSAAGVRYDLHFSAGTVVFDRNLHETPEALVAAADQRMYTQKRAKTGS